jgi:hypothetical protein
MDLLKRCLLFTGLLFVPLVMCPHPGSAQVRVDVHIGPPPAYRFSAPPPVVVIPGTYVYMIPDIDTDVFFFSGYWFRSHEGHWFRAGSYNGPWAYWPDNRVPRALMELPPDYRRVPPGYRRIPQAELRRGWAGWERDRYWDRDREWREGWHGRPEERRDEGRGRIEGRPEERRDEGRGRSEGRPGEDRDRGPGPDEHDRGRN